MTAAELRRTRPHSSWLVRAFAIWARRLLLVALSEQPRAASHTRLAGLCRTSIAVQRHFPALETPLIPTPLHSFHATQKCRVDFLASGLKHPDVACGNRVTS